MRHFFVVFCVVAMLVAGNQIAHADSSSNCYGDRNNAELKATLDLFGELLQKMTQAISFANETQSEFIKRTK